MGKKSSEFPRYTEQAIWSLLSAAVPDAACPHLTKALRKKQAGEVYTLFDVFQAREELKSSIAPDFDVASPTHSVLPTLDFKRPNLRPFLRHASKNNKDNKPLDLIALQLNYFVLGEVKGAEALGINATASHFFSGGILDDAPPLKLTARKAHFDHFKFLGATLRGNLSEATLQDCDATRTSFIDVSSPKLTLKNSRFSGCTFDGCDLSQLECKQTIFEGCTFKNTSLNQAKFSLTSTFKSCDFSGLKPKDWRNIRATSDTEFIACTFPKGMKSYLNGIGCIVEKEQKLTPAKVHHIAGENITPFPPAYRNPNREIAGVTPEVIPHPHMPQPPRPSRDLSASDARAAFLAPSSENLGNLLPPPPKHPALPRPDAAVHQLGNKPTRTIIAQAPAPDQVVITPLSKHLGVVKDTGRDLDPSRKRG